MVRKQRGKDRFRMAVLHLSPASDLPLLYTYEEAEGRFRTMGYVRCAGVTILEGVAYSGADTAKNRDKFLRKVLTSLEIHERDAHRIVAGAFHPSSEDAEPEPPRPEAPCEATPAAKAALWKAREQGDRQSNEGRIAETLAMRKQTVALSREIHTGADLGYDLSRLAFAYRKAGHTREALATMDEAVQLYRQAAQQNPWYERMLAIELLNLGLCLEEAQRRAEAVEAVTESITIFRQASITDPRFNEQTENSRSELRRLRGRCSGTPPVWWTVS